MQPLQHLILNFGTHLLPLLDLEQSAITNRCDGGLQRARTATGISSSQYFSFESQNAPLAPARREIHFQVATER